MPNPPVPMPLSEADYETIEEAVMETCRGRWFLAEYAKRHRHADTKMLLSAIERLAAAIHCERTAQSAMRIRFDLIDMIKAIAHTRAEIAAIEPDAAHHGKFGTAAEPLDSIVPATERATSDILAAVEHIQEIAWALREQGLAAEACDLIDARATDVSAACSFLDVTGQRTHKVVQVLRYLDGQLNTMADVRGLDGAIATDAVRARPTQALAQPEIPPPSAPAAPATPAAPLTFYHAPSAEARVAAEPHGQSPIGASPASVTRAPANAAAIDPMAALNALSAEEKIALFT